MWDMFVSGRVPSRWFSIEETTSTINQPRLPCCIRFLLDKVQEIFPRVKTGCWMQNCYGLLPNWFSCAECSIWQGKAVLICDLKETESRRATMKTLVPENNVQKKSPLYKSYFRDIRFFVGVQKFMSLHLPSNKTNPSRMTKSERLVEEMYLKRETPKEVKSYQFLI